MNTQITQKEYNPPYASTNKMEQLFFLLESRSFSELSSKDLMDRGFSESDSSHLLQGLKFLGLITPEGKTTESMRILSMKGDGRLEKMQEVIKSSYKKLYEIVPNAETLPRAQLHDEFMAIYKLSPRLTSTAVPAFLWLCSRAGLKVSEDSPRPTQKKKSNTSNIFKSLRKNDRKQYDKSFEHIPIASTGIKILIPSTERVIDEIAGGGLVNVRKELISFAEKVGLVNIEAKKEDVEGSIR